MSSDKEKRRVSNILRAVRRVLFDQSPGAIALHPNDYTLVLKYKHRIGKDWNHDGPKDDTFYGMKVFRSWGVEEGSIEAYDKSSTESITDFNE